MFKPGTYKFKGTKTFTIYVQDNGLVLVSPDAPLTLRISDIFNVDKWEEITNGSTYEAGNN